MSVLITGAAGFVGLNLAECLLMRGTRVVMLDLAPPPAQALAHFASLPGRLDIEVADVRDGATLAALLCRHAVTALIHGAALTAGLERERSEPAAIAEVNLTGTLKVLAAARQASVGRVVQLSSGAVFGAGGWDRGELVEDRDLPLPASLYGITKYAAERAALRFREAHGLDVAVARLGVVFGRWEYDTGVRDTLSIPLLLARLARAGGRARFCAELPDDWIYAVDAAAAIVALLDAPRLPHPLYHVGTGRRWSAADWCERLRAIWPAFSHEVVGRREDANIGAQAPAPRPPLSVERLRRDLGFEARFDAARALTDYTAWRDALHPPPALDDGPF
ncbi:NAD-dependent epimerase/dehydratase family protein [Trinickia mobilis]|uniref:NAD-dependent epimerase/dehydratase family protein n=1 Tax=Trinickia mobilis TaxID=2816356 RepID=UPI001A8F37DF|nr:NAD(P)-dependent oxidoreductase [Trinickia mobilis]